MGEVGWDADDACVAMTWIHAKRAKRVGVTLSTMVRAYSTAVRAPRGAPAALVSPTLATTISARSAAGRGERAPVSMASRRAWIQGLSLRGGAPATWPTHMRGAWPRYQRRFAEIYELVQRTVAGQVEDPCPGATFYGGPMDSVPRGHEQDESCVFEESRQLFYRPIGDSSAS